MPEKLPWFSFYPGDWLSDEKLRACSYSARGLWIDMLSLMHKNDRRGYLQLNGKPVTAAQLARMTGGATDEVTHLLAELFNAGVASATDDGLIYSRRITRDEHIRQIRREAGAKGGNPKLKGGYSDAGFVYAMQRDADKSVKIGVSKTPKVCAKQVSAKHNGQLVEILGCWPVHNMGVAETSLHEAFRPQCVGGEWFCLSDEDVQSIPVRLHMQNVKQTSSKGQANVKQTPKQTSDSDYELNTNTNTNTNPLPPCDSSQPKKARGKREGTVAPDIPAAIDTAEFREAWERWKKHRREKRAPLTTTSVEDQFKEMVSWGVFRAIAAINYSIKKGWTGIFEEQGAAKFVAPIPTVDPAAQTQELRRQAEEQFARRADPAAAGLLGRRRQADANGGEPNSLF